ncbi:MAG: universal stress protein [Roseitalea sp.]|jgi:nucleotide-binding universal stress UspA family protein|uniref:Universal stress protein n=1 Tax=Oceaniradius stylonematis TaxID=2184161 RepID=A0A3A8ARK1_9HYPH|nr:universal stress protein [Oceaniradius stylonematis]MBO6554774.1 universal stress protein [Roseitalea sp.]MBO6689954.1 universal stress protein [Henriciella sp.]MBO6953818.1 universal stress protein [Rhizobiaceae bacterium]MBO6613956.1 universal stress protein [Roseitalea sp.]MBO6673355.1 universal stress protein [Roseitalea sp.]
MFKTVLLPIDLSADASWKKALPAALRLSKPENPVLHVVTVMPDFGMSVVSGYFDKDFEDKALREVGEKLTEWVRVNVPDDIEVHPHVMHGRVYDQIITAANKLGVDAIVMASHTPELSDYLLGPNSARVVRHAKQSVFVVRGE